MKPRIIIAGGGTGGHIFPALSIGGALKKRFPDADILYVGALGGMEMNTVPQYGFPIRGIWISGIQRALTFNNLVKNLLFPLKLGVSLWQAWRIARTFNPEVVIGVGGYASGPMGRVASLLRIPLVICEQNAYPGLVNRWLGKKAHLILLGNADAQKYFNTHKTIVTGNPIRSFQLPERSVAITSLGLDTRKPTLLVLGGSLGAMTLNKAIQTHYSTIIASDTQWIWQCGKRYYEELKQNIAPDASVKLLPFVEDMNLAYGAADLVITRAGGSTLSEIIHLSKPAILVPSPNVAEDHQTKNAQSLVNQQAALSVKDAEAQEKLVPTALALVKDAPRLAQLKQRMEAVEKHDAVTEIIDSIIPLINKKGENNR